MSDQPSAHRPVRAGIDEQAHHDRDGDRTGRRRRATPCSTSPPASTSGATKTYSDSHRHERRRSLVDHRHPARVVERRHDHDRAEPAEGRARASAARLRVRREDRDRLPGPAERAPARSRRVLRRPGSRRPRSATASRSPRCSWSTCTRRSRIGGVSLSAASPRRDDRRARRAPRTVATEPARASSREKTAATMTTMLGEVVRDGTGACAAIPGYTVAGKTGTSRKAAPEGGYSTQTMASFVGFAPAENPRLAAIVVLDEPSNEFGSVARRAGVRRNRAVGAQPVPRGADRCRRPAAVRRGARRRRRRGQQLHRPARRRAPGAPRPAGRSRRGRRQDRRGRPAPRRRPERHRTATDTLADDTSPSD